MPTKIEQLILDVEAALAAGREQHLDTAAIYGLTRLKKKLDAGEVKVGDNPVKLVVHRNEVHLEETVPDEPAPGGKS